VLGVLIKKITSESATIAMIVGLFIGLVRFVGQILIDNGIIHLNFAEHLLSIHAFSFAFVLFVVSAAILLGFSFIPGILFPPVTSRKMESL
jgi:hypothetical protein